MIKVVAMIETNPGCREQFIRIFRENIPRVLQETGCISYEPSVDIETDLAAQSKNENRVTIMEAWERLEDLKHHLQSPHMAAYREKVKDLVADVKLLVMEPIA